MVAGHHRPVRGAALDDLCGVAARTRAGDRPQAGISERAVQRHHAGQPVFSGRQRLHADLRADAQRQSRARLALFARRLYRLRLCDPDRLLVPRCVCRLRDRRAARHRVAGGRVPLDGGTGTAPDPGDDRNFDRAGRSDAVGGRRRLLPDRNPVLAGRSGAIAFRAGDALRRRGGDAAIPAGTARYLRLGGGDRYADVAGAEQDPARHADPRRRR